MRYYIQKGFLTSFLEEHPSINKIYIHGTSIDFEDNFMILDEHRTLTIYVDTNEIMRKIKSALTMATNVNIESIESLFQEIESLKEEMQNIKHQFSELMNTVESIGPIEDHTDSPSLDLQSEMDSIKENLQTLKDSLENMDHFYPEFLSLKDQVSNLLNPVPRTGLQGIVTIQPDSDGKIGFYIPGLLQIDNQNQNGFRGTDGNLVLEHPHGRLLHRKQ